MAKYIGKEMSRVDGVAKVTGKAKYAAEFQVPNIAYGFIVQSAIAKGAIKTIDTTEAEKQAGVVRIFTHENAPKPGQPKSTEAKPQTGSREQDKSFRALQSNRIYFNMQPVALVVAETFEQARHAARLVKVSYAEEKPMTDMEAAKSTAFNPNPDRAPKPRGNAARAFASAPVKVEAEYTIPIEHHNPMEPHGAIAFWENDKLTIFDKTQGVFTVRRHLATSFDVPEENVNVVSPFVGGAFGSSLRANYYPWLAAMSAQILKRPVKLIYTRQQMFTGNGYRPHSWQKVRLGADKNGKLQSMIHESMNNSSTTEDYLENITNFTRSIYACPNIDTPQKLVKTDMATPCAMRAPGAVSGMFALECAMDELAYKLKIDPLELRLINYSEVNPDNNKPYSSKALRECYALASEKFGWKNRKFEPRSMRDGRLLVGWGTATGTWGAFLQAATVRIVYKVDGTAHITSGVSDIGPGTYTVITMIAAEHLGLPAKRVKFELGDSKFPRAPSQGGSWTTASVGTAAFEAANNIKQKLLDLANKDANSPFKTAKIEAVELTNGKLQLKGNTSNSLNIADLMRKNNLNEIVEQHESKPSPERQKYATAAHGAQFVEVKIDPDVGTVQVTRVVEATACGKIMNPKTSHSQEIGGVVWGIGMALTEGTEVDHRFGRIMNPNLQHYHVPSNADVLNIETLFVEEDDKIVNPLGVKGMGELGMVGIPAAIANAVFHATGRRVRDLPITPDKLL
ncbi:MAG: xanthine dehydrogenase family protein molybdopterin-binding subunit [Acidobacteriota bacterium]|nr:xanthine dehydrogenase family protein molybdopterin-binding subunit [Acidobacteriota bacterium]